MSPSSGKLFQLKTMKNSHSLYLQTTRVVSTLVLKEPGKLYLPQEALMSQDLLHQLHMKQSGLW